MPFTLIQGTFHVVNYSPDGDSIRFAPADVDLVRSLSGSRPKINARGHVQLRIEAIDTLETHYAPVGSSGAGVLHQPLALALEAAEVLMNFTGIRNVRWNANQTAVSAADDGTPGYILSRSVEKNGRPVAFVFAGPPPGADGAQIKLDVDLLQESYNLKALSAGLAYPTYYKGLFHDLREALTQATTDARAREVGIYAVGQDSTVSGFTVNTIADLTDDCVILPKLFRRLSEYLVEVGAPQGFKHKMAQAQEPVLDLRTANFTHFDSFIEQSADGTQLRLTRRPEELIFDEMPSRPANHFSLLLQSDSFVV